MTRSFALVALAASALGGCRSPSTAPSGHGVARPDAQADPAAVIEYRGQEVRLSKRYDDYDVYKNDPNNIAPEERDRVKRLVTTAPVPERCASSDEVFQALFALEFPGYGSNGVGEQHANDPLRVVGRAIEIPYTDTSRVVVYMRDDRGYRLIDDTVLPEPPLIVDAIVRDGKVTYRSLEGNVIAERPIRRGPDH
jgi:hypothetical protein